MANRYKWLDIVFFQFSKNFMVELQTCLIGFLLGSFGINTAPADGHTEHRIAHLCQ